MGPSSFCLIVGAMKCGTSKLFYDMGCHRQICLSRTKETNFFVSVVKDRNDSFDCSKLLDDYCKFWPSWNPQVHRVALEASPNYSKFPFQPTIFPALQRMAEATGVTVKIVYILRNPVHAVASFYRHAFTAEKQWALNHSTAIREHGILSVHPVALYSYAKQIDLMIPYVGADSILLLNFDDFVCDPGSVVAQVATFLDLDANFVYRDSHKQHSVVQRLAEVGRAAYLEDGSAIASWSLDEVSGLAVQLLLADDMCRLRNDYGFDCSKWLS